MRVQVLAVFLLASTLLPLGVSAQDTTDESRDVPKERIWEYRGRSREWEEKINSLGGISTTTLSIPVVIGVAVKDLTPNFGDPRPGGRTHEGEDIMAPRGTPVVSPTPAVVLRIGDGTSSGKYVRTANPGGESFVYMHLDSIGENLHEGDVITRGTLIGYVGNTGNASGGATHLHFEIHDNSGTPIDPFPRLTQEFSIQEKINFLSAIIGQAPPILPTTPTNVSEVIVFTRDLKLGKSGEDVRDLQKLLNATGFIVATTGSGSPGNETTYFGRATQAAVIKFQIARGIKPALGYVGPITRKFLSAL